MKLIQTLSTLIKLGKHLITAVNNNAATPPQPG